MKKIFGFFLLLLITISQLFASTIYYVDATNGNDVNPGTSQSSPWKTITKINSHSFSPGDSILFKRGETWSGSTLTIDNSGSSGNPITFGAYGIGAKPIITIFGSLPGWDNPGNWINYGGNIWYISSSLDNRRLWLSDSEYLKAETINDINSSSRWFWHSGTNRLYVYATSNPASFYSDIEAPFTTSPIYTVVSYNYNYVTIENLDIQAGWRSLYLPGCDHFIIDNCNIGMYSGRDAICLERLRGTFASYIEIKNCVIESGYNFTYDYHDVGIKEGINMKDGVNNCKIYNNNIANWGHCCILLDGGPSASPVNDNEIYDNILESPNTSYCRGFATQGGNSLCQNNKFFRNIIRFMTTKNQINGNDNEFYYNIVYSVRQSPCITATDVGNAFTFEGYGGFVCYNNRLYNNIIYDTDSAGIRVQHSSSYSTKTGNLIRNNIIMKTGQNSILGDYGIGIKIDNGSSVGANSYQNNSIYTSAANLVVHYRGTNMSISLFNSENGTAGDIIGDNINSNPLFINASNGNFMLQSTSPCIDTGMYLELTEDFAGNSVPYGYGFDIGAYEYVGENLPLNANADASPTSGETPLTVNFTGNAAGGTAPYSYSWDFGDGGYSTEQNPSHTYYADGNYTAILTLTDNEGNQDSDSVTITVTAPLTPVEASGTASPNSGDSPLTVDFTGNATGGIPPYTYNWNFGDGQSSSQQNPSHTYNNAGNYTATLTVTDSNTSQDSDSLTINVTSPAPPPLVASCIASPTSGDVPFTVYFTGIASGGTPPYSYNWNFGDGGNSSQQNPSHTYNVAGNYTVTFTVTDSQSIQDSVSLTITATLSPTPAYLSCSPTNFYFGVSISGTLSSSQNMRLINAGDGTMTWNAAESTPWLSCSPLSGTNRGQVSISVNASGLSPGTYNAIITVSSPQAYNSPQLIKVNLRVYESGLESDPSEDTDDRFDGTPVGGRAAIAERTLPNARFKEVEAKTNSDPNNPIAANSSLGLVSKGSVSMADNSTENRDLGRPELKSNDQELETGGLEIGLEEIWKGHELQSVGDEEMEEDRMTIDQSGKLEPQKHKPRLSTEKNPSDIPNVQIEESEPLRIVFSRSMRENISFIGWGEDELTALPIGSTLDMLKGEFSWIPQPGSIGQYILHFAVTDGSRKSRPLRIVVDVIPKSND